MGIVQMIGWSNLQAMDDRKIKEREYYKREIVQSIENAVEINNQKKNNNLSIVSQKLDFYNKLPGETYTEGYQIEIFKSINKKEKRNIASVIIDYNHHEIRATYSRGQKRKDILSLFPFFMPTLERYIRMA